MAEIIINVKPDGKTDVKVEGHNGPSCAALSEPYRKALGKEVTNTPTAEMYAEETNTVEVKQ